MSITSKWRTWRWLRKQTKGNTRLGSWLFRFWTDLRLTFFLGDSGGEGDG